MAKVLVRFCTLGGWGWAGGNLAPFHPLWNLRLKENHSKVKRSHRYKPCMCEGRLESLMHPSFLSSHVSSGFCQEALLVQTALYQTSASHRFQTWVATLECGILLALIECFLNWQMDLDAFRSIRPEEEQEPPN